MTTIQPLIEYMRTTLGRSRKPVAVVDKMADDDMGRTSSRVAAAALLSALLLVQPAAQAADPAATTARAQPRYTLQSGRGWAVCEAYVKFLNATPADEDPPLCDMKLERVPGMRKLEWEELDIAAYLPVVHQIELLLGVGQITPAPAQDFDLWEEQVRRRIKAQDQTPRLRRTRLALVPDGPVETVLSYDQDAKLCQKDVGKLKRGDPYHSRPGQPNFFIFDEARQRVMGNPLAWLVDAAGKLWLYLDRPYYFNLYLEGGIGREMMNPGTLAGLLVVKRLEPDVQSEYYKSAIPNEPPYRYHELCTIQFKYPIARIHN